IALSADERMIQETVRQIVEKELAPIADDLDRKEEFADSVFQTLGKNGILGIVIPEEYGGSGASLLSGVLAIEELARRCGGTALSFGAHAFIGAYNIYKACNEEQKKKYLPALCSGEKYGAFALTEPGSGSDSMGMQTRATKKGDRYVLNGSKTFITNGSVADTFLVFARTGEAGPRGVSAFIVERGWKGFSNGKPMEKMGMRASPTTELFFEDCEVPQENLVGVENEGYRIAFAGLDMERTLFAGLPIGLIQGVLDICLKYTVERLQFGKPLASFQMVQDMVARMGMDLFVSRLMAYNAARKLEQGQKVTLHASFTKLFASEASVRSTLDGIQLLGGYGYVREYGVERLMRDSKLVEIGGGTSQIQKLIIAREMYAQAGFKM
ncbi:MAG: acyl-CoA dehydrogenase family protein, partial [Leptospiraceae bacterium]|nr:acyl-CoA dehydrogenase family protein [Leptospiraceae bacterium]